MDFKELCEKRYSVRHFQNKAIKKEKLDYLLQCFRHAPSAVNFQPWKVFVITNSESRKQVETAYDREWFKNAAPCYIIICKNEEESWKRTNYDSKDFGDIDIAIASEHLALAATSIGLGTCWVCNFDPKMLREVLKLESNLEPIVIFPVGYIDEEKSKIPTRKRKETSDFVQWID